MGYCIKKKSQLYLQRVRELINFCKVQAVK